MLATASVVDIADLAPGPDTGAVPPVAACEAARRSRDARFDGLFFTAVHSTRIYCRPVCPAPFAHRVSYYAHAAAAEAAGYRPCLRCRPELAPGDGGWRRGDAALARALTLIDAGALSDMPLAALAARVGIGERQLRRLFVQRIGAAPQAVHGTRRLLFAKQLLTETALPVTDVALSSGFGSLRRFNDAFLAAYRMAPRDLRRLPADARPPASDVPTLRLGYRPPYDFDAMLAFARAHVLPGVEVVDASGYSRTVAGVDGGAPGWLRVDAWPGAHALRLRWHAPAGSRLLPAVARLRRMFDLDADSAAIAAVLGADPRLAPLLHARPGLRLPGGWDGFEIAVRAVVGQQVSVAAACTFATRLAHAFGAPLADAARATAPAGLTHLFPTPASLAEADLSAIGVTRARADTLRAVSRALLEGRIDFATERTLADHVARWTAVPGIGPWTAHYVAMRALSHPDAFPADDLVLQQAIAATPAADARHAGRTGARVLAARAEAWRPWRAYAALHLWRDARPPPATGDPRP